MKCGKVEMFKGVEMFMDNWKYKLLQQIQTDLLYSVTFTENTCVNIVQMLLGKIQII